MCDPRRVRVYHGDMHIHSCTSDVPVEAGLDVNGMIAFIWRERIPPTTGPAEHERDVLNERKEVIEAKGVRELEEVGGYAFR